jgi:hypothetical protein
LSGPRKASYLDKAGPDEVCENGFVGLPAYAFVMHT